MIDLDTATTPIGRKGCALPVAFGFPDDEATLENVAKSARGMLQR